MKYSVTAAEAAKMLKKLNEEKLSLISEENNRCEFNATIGEDIESVRPDYDYTDMRRRMDKCDRNIRIIKHAINLFNSSHEISPGMTIDQALVYIPQLSAKKQRLYQMQSMLPKQRAAIRGAGNNPFVDYTYANYPIEKAKKDYVKTSDELRAVQIALDTANNTVKLEFEIPD